MVTKKDVVVKKKDGIISRMEHYPFLKHLEELRKRIIYCVVAIIVFSIASYGFADRLLYFLAKPIGKLVFVKPMEAFMSYLKLSVFCGLLFSVPVLLYHLWAFISPGLMPNEKKYVAVYGPMSILLFFIGSAFAYFIVVPFGVKFLLSYGNSWLVPMITVENYVSFFCVTFLVFGVIFELPVLVLLLSQLGVVTPSLLRKNRRYIILVIFIVAAILTPPDVFSQIIMVIPLMILYEFSIFISYLGGRKK